MRSTVYKQWFLCISAGEHYLSITGGDYAHPEIMDARFIEHTARMGNVIFKVITVLNDGYIMSMKP